ncbi:ATP-binding protein [uncultured Clostridium sp.]|jgi:DNA replication protein DnaC|uniref:ATP-binding protein n=1 Tax=uncultured Clostridium sp. TaxID=59620 RepID=UPI0026272599|nr:ATP-binding protein [uncultured Clostridium sp.]
MQKGIKTKILNSYEKTRELEKSKLSKRITEIRTKHPDIAELDTRISTLCTKLAIIALKNSSNKAQEIDSLKNLVEDIRAQKFEALVANGYATDYLNLHYICKECKDTGYLGVKKCSCYNRRYIEILLKDSEISELLTRNNFSNFTLAHYRANKMDHEKISPKENMQMLVDNIQESYLENFDTHERNLLFTGGPGTGKSFLSHCIAKELMDKGNFVIYRTSDELLTDLKDIKFNNNKNLESSIVNCDLLIIDDLGAEQITEFSITELFTFLNKKLLKRKKMIISTNFTIESLKHNYDERIMSRLLGNFNMMKFIGDDIRIEMKKKKKRT